MSFKRIALSLVVVTFSIVSFGLFNTKFVTNADEGDGNATKLTITMTEYNFTFNDQKPGADIVLNAGQDYELTVVNNGKIQHELWFGKNPPAMEDGKMDGYDTNLFDGFETVVTGKQGTGEEEFEIHSNALHELDLYPGQELTIEFNLPDSTKGAWEIGCFQPVPGTVPTEAATASADATQAAGYGGVPHYMAGMKAKLTVK